ncbi:MULTISPECIES: DUF2188 domain-containing protein [unclassified Enterococcus]|uniref:DUF2188 domain-containing protein n=1 Tax=unclassified Enterococcus TaxID=2608891 RepID=UPI0013EABBD6|nr:MULTISPECIES: DUF2188 domain-containing protein [unclassified Enterococcus]
MPWNMNDFPPAMKNLEELTRKKAIDIGNALLDEGYPDSRAIPIAIDQAKEWFDGASESEKKDFAHEKNPSKNDKHETNPRAAKLLDADVTVKFEEDRWVVRSKGAEKASNHFDTKDEAVEKGKEIARNKETSVVVYKKDGSKDREIHY